MKNSNVFFLESRKTDPKRRQACELYPGVVCLIHNLIYFAISFGWGTIVPQPKEMAKYI